VAQTHGEIRGDLIRRLFVVAISVGAASTLAQMPWVHDGRWPNLSEWQQLSILVAAMTATVLSWDGYLLAIDERPLVGFWRFAIDITLVFIYMFLLMTSVHHTWWLFIHVLIFLLYIIWDYLSVREHLWKYFSASFAGTRLTVGEVYIGGFKDREGVSCGPIITLGWGVYFLILYAINIIGLANRIFGTTIFALAGLILYRIDKRERYTMCKRSLLVVLWLLASLAYIKFGPRDDAIGQWFGKMVQGYI
jgi:hypothetical protein